MGSADVDDSWSYFFQIKVNVFVEPAYFFSFLLHKLFLGEKNPNQLNLSRWIWITITEFTVLINMWLMTLLLFLKEMHFPEQYLFFPTEQKCAFSFCKHIFFTVFLSISSTDQEHSIYLWNILCWHLQKFPCPSDLVLCRIMHGIICRSCVFN